MLFVPVLYIWGHGTIQSHPDSMPTSVHTSQQLLIPVFYCVITLRFEACCQEGGGGSEGGTGTC